MASDTVSDPTALTPEDDAIDQRLASELPLATPAGIAPPVPLAAEGVRGAPQSVPAASTRLGALRLIVVLGALSAFGPLSIDMYLPALPSLARDFAATDSQVQLTLSACLLGLAGGQLLRFSSWRGVFVTLALVSVVLLLAAATTLRETLPRERRQVGGIRATLATFARLLADRVFLGYALACGLAFAAMFAYISGSP